MNAPAPQPVVLDDAARRLMQNLVLDLLQHVMRQAGAALSPESVRGLAQLRALVNAEHEHTPRTEALRAWGSFFTGLAGGMRLVKQPAADDPGQTIH